MMAVKSISKLRGQTNNSLYPQPEGLLGECMTKYGKELGEDSLYGKLYCVLSVTNYFYCSLLYPAFISLSHHLFLSICLSIPPSICNAVVLYANHNGGCYYMFATGNPEPSTTRLFMFFFTLPPHLIARVASLLRTFER
jgi:hypothetical protein